MKLLIIVTLFNLAALLHGEEPFRQWKEADGKRSIEAKIVDKRLDDTAARLVLKGGKSLWIEAKVLIKEDQDYIKNWIKRTKHIKAKPVAMGKGWKRIKIEATAGSRDLVVKAYWRSKGKQPKGYPKVFKLKKGEEKIIEVKVGPEYMVRGYHKKEIVDEEKWNTKTGL